MILFPKDLVALRPVTAMVKGEVKTSAYQAIPFVGDIQPLSNRDAASLNVGRADLGKIRIFSDIQLQEEQTAGASNGDRVSFQGKVFEVIQESAHQNSLLDHYTYVAELRT